jgi:hypothetical protein
MNSGRWWDGLDASEQKSVDFTVSLLQQVGPTLRMPHSSSIEMSRHARTARSTRGTAVSDSLRI